MGKASRSKDEFPPLLEPGIHRFSVADLEAKVVPAFPKSTRRAALWKNLRELIKGVTSLGIPCDIWIDGSFLTEKIDPDDIDLVVEASINVFEFGKKDQLAFLKQLGAGAFRGTKNLHTFVFPNAPIGHRAYPMTLAVRQQWTKDFGTSFVKREPKGIALVEVRP